MYLCSIILGILFYILFCKYEVQSIWINGNIKLKICTFQSRRQLIRELPLLYNILIGTLSFVGSQMVPANQNNPKLLFNPGLTGLSHLKNNSIEIDSIRQFENYYAMHYSFIFDIEIIFKSIFKI